jgi:endoglucanase
LPLKGVSESSAEFGQNLPGTAGKDYTWPVASSIQHFASKGFGAFRVPFLWERLQPQLKGEFDAAYLQGLEATVSTIVAAGGKAIIDPHNYARYSTNGQVSGGQVIGTGSVTVDDFQDLWSRLATHFAANSNVVFAIMNEPHTMSTGQWASIAQTTIKTIRNTGAKQLVLVPGNGWTGAWSWMQTWPDSEGKLSNGDAFAGFSDPANNFAFEMHQYLDSDHSGTHDSCSSDSAGVDALTPVTQWLESHGFRAFLGEFAGGNNDQCSRAVDNMMSYMDQHPAWIGWTWWAAGPWWGSAFSSVEPNADGSDKPQVAWLQKHLGSSVVV